MSRRDSLGNLWYFKPGLVILKKRDCDKFLEIFFMSSICVWTNLWLSLWSQEVVPKSPQNLNPLLESSIIRINTKITIENFMRFHSRVNDENDLFGLLFYTQKGNNWKNPGPFMINVPEVKISLSFSTRIFVLCPSNVKKLVLQVLRLKSSKINFYSYLTRWCSISR